MLTQKKCWRKSISFWKRNHKPYNNRNHSKKTLPNRKVFCYIFAKIKMPCIKFQPKSIKSFYQVLPNKVQTFRKQKNGKWLSLVIVLLLRNVLQNNQNIPLQTVEPNFQQCPPEIEMSFFNTFLIASIISNEKQRF